MGMLYEEITDELAAWINQQHMFFVATAPLAASGHVNCSPKGLDALRILGSRAIAYLDVTGSGAETAAHLRENGRIVFMFCEMTGTPKILRLHGVGSVILPESAQWDELAPNFPTHPGARSIVRAEITRIADSCGFGVPKYEFVRQRRGLSTWAEAKGVDGLASYRAECNRRSIDGLPGLDI
jgi:Pyridoxamine 5'-phosphate oxidase